MPSDPSSPRPRSRSPEPAPKSPLPDSGGGVIADLTPEEVEVLLALAMHHMASSPTRVLTRMAEARRIRQGWAGSGFRLKDIQAILPRLAARDLALRDTGGWILNPMIRSAVFGAAFADPVHRPRAEALANYELKCSFYFNSYYHYPGEMVKLQIRLELLVHTGRFEEAEKFVRQIRTSSGLRTIGSSLCLAFLVEHLPAERFAELSPDLQARGLREYLVDAAISLRPPLPAWRAFGRMEPSADIVVLAATVHFLRAEEAEVLELVEMLRAMAGPSKGPLSPEKTRILADARMLEGCLAFAKGCLDEAVATFEESVAIEKKQTRRRKLAPRWLGGPLHALALCLRGGTRDLEDAQRIGQWCAELDETELAPLAACGRRIADRFSGGDSTGVSVHTPFRRQDREPSLQDLFAAIAERVEGSSPKVLDTHAKLLDSLAERAAGNGYDWIAAEAGALAASLRNDDAARARAADFSGRRGLEGMSIFSDKLRPPEPWEARLKAVESIAERFGRRGGDKAAARKKAEQRREFVWILRLKEHRPRSPVNEYDDIEAFLDAHFLDDLDELEESARARVQKGNAGSAGDDDAAPDQPVAYRFELSAIERTVSASGRAGRGRKVSPKRLFDEPDKIASMTDQDRSVARHFSKRRGWSGRDVYELRSPAVLLDLVGHPLVFSDEKATRPLAVQKGRVRVEIGATEGERVAARLVPRIAPGTADAAVVPDGPDRCIVYEIPKTVEELARVFDGAESLTFPASAEGRFMGAVSALAADLEIGAESSLEGLGAAGDLVSVAGDAIPRLQLVPEGGGLRATLVVRPIPGCDFAYPPGSGKEIVFGMAGGERVQATRELATEKARADAVASSVPALARRRGESPDPWQWKLESPQDALETLRDLQLWIGEAPAPAGAEKAEKGDDEPKVVLEWPEGETFRVFRTIDAEDASLRLGGGEDWLSLSGEIELDEGLVLSMRRLLELSAASERPGFVEIDRNRFVALTEEFQRQIEDLQALSQPGKGEEIRVPTLAAAALEEFVEKAGKDPGGDPSAWRACIEQLRSARDHRPDPPTGLHAELRPYQLDGYRWLSRLARAGAGACLADDMGLGKTVQTLALLLETAASGPSLVVAPTSVAANWLEETLRFAPSLNPVVLGESGDRAALLAGLGPRDLVLCTYGLLPREEEALAAVDWNVIVLDEAQAIKNSATRRSASARKLRGRFRLATTGTPVENRLAELHTLFQFILPGYLGSWERFRRRFADPIERDEDAAARGRLRRLIRPFLLRRLKSGVLRDLPERTEVTLHVDLGPDERAFYEAVRRRAVAELQDAGERAMIRILAELTRLRRACCHPALVDPKLGASIGGAKLAAFIEILDELVDGGHKVLVFSQFVDHLQIVRRALDEKSVRYQYLDGSTPAGRRKQAIDAFQRGEGDAFLISLKAGGFGINLTAADYVVHMDPWWNPAAEDQASDRAHRIGQTRPVTIYRLVARDTIEEKIVQLHHRKRELADSLLSDSDDAEARLSADDLLALLRE